jgi:HD-GYP domain-containing protein (c-di-GMP phosphodiesterase class II)
METALRTCLLAVELAHELGLKGEALRDVYYTALLRFVGCTAYAHETAALYGGDDQSFLRSLSPVDGARPTEILAAALRGTRERGVTRQAVTLVNLVRDPKGGDKVAKAHCDLAVALAARLGMNERVIAALGQIYERFDGKGTPVGSRGEQVDLPARILQVSFRVEVQRALIGPGEAIEAVRQRSGSELDPQIADIFLRRAQELLAILEAPSVWDTFLSGFSAADCESLRLAALLHDLGRVSVPNGIWDKPGQLNAAEWERVRLHPYYTERILKRSPLLSSLAEASALHHERLDGSGYYRGLAGAAISRPARILAAADAYHAMTEQRPHRKSRSAGEAARLLTAEAQAGRLDREAVESVLAGSGQRASARLRGELPAALTERESDVLCLLARGLSNKAIAAELVISPRTVQHHLEHIYDKTGIRTRAAAAVFAVVNDLVDK